MKWVHPLKGRNIKETIADVFEIQENLIWRNSSPWHRQTGGAEWGFEKGTEHYFSFDSMKRCLRNGYKIIKSEHGFEVSAKI